MKISFVGDISTGEHYFSFGHGPKTAAEKNFLFENVAPLLNQQDYVVGNLEGPISDVDMRNTDPESMVFRGAPSFIEQLKRSNINIVSIANNHILQHSEAVFFDTIKQLEHNNIRVIGKINQAPIVLTQDNLSIGLLGCSDVPDNIVKDQTLYQTYNDEFLAIVKQAVTNHTHVIVFIHWGREDTHKPTERQEFIEKELQSLGVRAIIGHHSHIFYPIKNTPDFFCAYSLGDFLFDLSWDEKLLKSGIVHFDIEASTQKITPSFTPVYLDNKGSLPSITGKTIAITNNHFDFYQFDAAVKHLQIKKIMYFLLNFFRGNKSLKQRFLFSKIQKKLGM